MFSQEEVIRIAKTQVTSPLGRARRLGLRARQRVELDTEATPYSRKGKTKIQKSKMALSSLLQRGEVWADTAEGAP